MCAVDETIDTLYRSFDVVLFEVVSFNELLETTKECTKLSLLSLQQNCKQLCFVLYYEVVELMIPVTTNEMYRVRE